MKLPFLDRDLIKYAMKVPAGLKIKENIKKYILREVAINLGLPDVFAFRKKKAAQYGSRFDKAIYKNQRKNGFKYKSNYIESLIEKLC